MKRIQAPKRPTGRLLAASLALLLTALAATGCSSRTPQAGTSISPAPASPTAASSSTSPNQAATAEPSSPSAFPSAAASNPPSPPATLSPSPSVADDSAAAKVSRMSTAEKIGQLVVVGMEGTSVDAATRSMIEERHIGGIIFFKPNLQNSAQMLALANELKRTNRGNPLPLWLSLDQEGGRVNRLPAEFVKLPTNLAIGKADSAAFSRQIGNRIGEVLHGFGYNLNFAPVLDVNSNPNNPVIGDRSFGNSPTLVGSLGTATMRGFSERNVIPVVKHFPGHGDTSVDSHIGLPVVNYGRDRLNKVELVPFKTAIRAGADAVMVAHILMPKFDSKYPASFSQAIVGGLLRKDLDFQGVVFTDDMTMGAVVEHYDLGESAVRAILAGGDVVLVCHDDAKERLVLDALAQAVKDGRISAARLNESVDRIARLKMKYGLNDAPAAGADSAAFNAGTRALLRKYMP